MDSDGPVTVVKRRRLGIWLWRLAALALLVPPLVFGASNLWLASKWGREAVASRISRRCGLETRIGGASWSPWNGITVRDLTLLQPEALRGQVSAPMLEIGSLRVRPVWREWAGRRFTVSEVIVERPRLVLTVEILSHLASRMQPPAAPPLASAEPAEAGPAVPPQAPTVPDAPPAAPAPPPQPAPAAPAEETAPTAWLRVKSAAVLLQSASSGTVWLETSGVDAAVPLGGAPANGEVAAAVLTVAGRDILTNMRIPLHWRAPVLATEPGNLRVAGLDVRCAAQVAFQPGLPVYIAAELPRQALPATEGPGGVVAQAREVSLQARFLGGLLVPGSWQGDLLGNASGIGLRHPSRTLEFDTARCAAVIRGGMLACPDFRLLGEDLSLLGNGMLLADGRLAAVLRVAAPPDTAAALARHAFPGLANDPKPVPLSTPQRAALDLTLDGTLREPVLRLGGEEITTAPPTTTPPPP